MFTFNNINKFEYNNFIKNWTMVKLEDILPRVGLGTLEVSIMMEVSNCDDVLNSLQINDCLVMDKIIIKRTTNMM